MFDGVILSSGYFGNLWDVLLILVMTMYTTYSKDPTYASKPYLYVRNGGTQKVLFELNNGMYVQSKPKLIINKFRGSSFKVKSMVAPLENGAYTT